ncbi:MAG: nicotinate phosphoribosyltransferase [Alphaproteobacteria bacterium]|nr:nicotinate phosphoribosyltransferase [Alphaproteobacteria bacterium]
MFDPDFTRGTDKYFLKTKAVVAKNGDVRVTYAIFMRVPIILAPRLMVEWLTRVAKDRKTEIKVDMLKAEGDYVGGGEPLAYISGSLMHLADLETHFLQKIGPACVAAYNAYRMCCDLPKVAFLAMDARHCAGAEMAEMMAYAASVGSRAAQRDIGAVGFTGNATDSTAPFFGNKEGLGTMPHALVGYAGSTVRAAELLYELYPDDLLVVLVDYYGQEISDSIAACQRFPALAAAGRLAVRLDTHGGRYIEGLDPAQSYAVLVRHKAEAIQQYRTEAEQRWLVGTGVSAAAIWRLREALDKAGFPKVKIVASSGFNPVKCRVMASAAAPIDIVGTGSYLPERWEDTYATADIIEYDGRPSVKVGREFLMAGWQQFEKKNGGAGR